MDIMLLFGRDYNFILFLENRELGIIRLYAQLIDFYAILKFANFPLLLSAM